MLKKKELRKEMGSKRKKLEQTWIRKASDQIIVRLISLPSYRKAKQVALYMALPGEVDLTPLFKANSTTSKQISIPVFNPQTKLYQLAEIDSQTQMHQANYGILEPKNPHFISISNINVMVIPAVAYDTKGNRLGRGGGYYDRFLKEYNGTSIGVAFDFQLIPQVPNEPHDQPVHFVVTEKQCINVLNER